MEINGSREILTSKPDVWQALIDVDTLQACIPGCREMTGSLESGYEATVTQKIGPVKATFRVVVSISDIVEGESYKISGEGKGGAAGFAKGSADVMLEELENGTKLTYNVEGRIGGKLAQLGSRLISGVARKLADEFFERFKKRVENPLAPADAS